MYDLFFGYWTILFDIRRYFNLVIYLFISVMLLLPLNMEGQILITNIIKNVADV
jgi:hypothetical protein